MADVTSTNTKTNQQEVGAHDNDWGDELNTNFEMLDKIAGDTVTVNTTGGNTTLTADQHLAKCIRVTGALVSQANLIFDGRGLEYIIENDTTGSFDVVSKLSGQTGIATPQGARMHVRTNGAGTDMEAVLRPATNAETQAQASKVGFVTPSALANRAGFSAYLVADYDFSAGSTSIAFDFPWTQETDIGSYFAPNIWTPPPGWVLMHLQLAVFFDDAQVSSLGGFLIIKKDGTSIAQTQFGMEGSDGVRTYDLTVLDLADGTEGYTAHASVVGARDGQITFRQLGGVIKVTTFKGVMI